MAKFNGRDFVACIILILTSKLSSIIRQGSRYLNLGKIFFKSHLRISPMIYVKNCFIVFIKKYYVKSVLMLHIYSVLIVNISTLVSIKLFIAFK